MSHEIYAEEAPAGGNGWTRQARQGSVPRITDPHRRAPVNLYFLLALICLVLWLVLAFGLALPSGWVHTPLAVAAVLFAVGIVKADETRNSK